MNRIKYIWCLFIIVGIINAKNFYCFAQLPQQIIFQTDRDIYIVGDEILVNAIVFSESTEILSKVLYVEVYDYNKNVVSQKKFEINNNGLAYGRVKIPDAISTQNYFIRAYTNNSKKYSPELFPTKVLTVVNPEVPISNNKLQEGAKNINAESLEIKKQDFSKEHFVLNKNVFEPREKVNLRITDFSKYEFVSLSVVKKGAYLKRDIISTNNTENILANYTRSDESKTELIGNTISGKVIAEDGTPLKNKRIYLSVFDGKQQFHSTLSDSIGRFMLEVFPGTYGTNKIVVQKDPIDTIMCKILLDYDFTNKFPDYYSSLELDSADRDLLEELYVNQQLSSRAQEMVQSPLNDTSFSMFGKPDISVELNDFVELPNLKEIFNEIIPFVSVKQKNKTPYLSVFNEFKGQFYNSPLVLLDYAPVFNIEELLQIKPENLKKIDVINRAYQLGHFAYYGIVNIQTKNSNLANYSFPNDVVFFDFEGVSFPYHHNSIEYISKHEKLSRSPDFRTVLYWNPNVVNDSISFFTSDHCSDYQVVLTGVDKSGQTTKTIQTITVK